MYRVVDDNHSINLIKIVWPWSADYKHIVDTLYCKHLSDDETLTAVLLCLWIYYNAKGVSRTNISTTKILWNLKIVKS